MALGNIPDHLITKFIEQMNSIKFIPYRFLPMFDRVPVRKHELKRWMTKSNYHQRIQKKWNKRFGFKDQRSFFYSDGTVYAHPENITFVKNLL